MGKLQALQVERLVAPGKHADGNGLYFIVAGATARSWSYRYWFTGKERWYGLGSLDQDHHVPLSAPALAVLDELRDGSQGELMFPNEDGEQFSENAMLAVLARLGYGHVTVHGFRSTFATWAEECTDYPDGVREAALAHKYKSETTAAYQRGQKLEKRRALMADWTAFALASNVVEIAGRARA